LFSKVSLEMLFATEFLEAQPLKLNKAIKVIAIVIRFFIFFSLQIFNIYLPF
jgi:hypothetical protein